MPKKNWKYQSNSLREPNYHVQQYLYGQCIHCSTLNRRIQLLPAALESALVHHSTASNTSPLAKQPLLKRLPFYCDIFYPVSILENHKSPSEKPEQVILLVTTTQLK